MFTPDPSELQLIELYRRALTAIQPGAVLDQLLVARSDVRRLMRLVDDLDEQLQDALGPGRWGQ